MTDPRTGADDAIHHLERLSSTILDHVGDGPSASTFAEITADVGRAVVSVGVPALNEVTGLLAGIAGSLSAGVVDWSPALGGTLIAAVDDLRTLVTRASQFSAEDSEHLHQRAIELQAYVKVAPRTSSSSAATAPELTSDAPAAAVSAPTPAASPAEPPRPAVFPNESPAPKKPDPVIPISELFYSGETGIVSGGVPKSATALSDLLGAGVDALEKNLVDKPLATSAAAGPMQIVPVESLIYRGRAALERAAELRDRIKSAGGSAAPATLDEMYDLIGLALKE